MSTHDLLLTPLPFVFFPYQLEAIQDEVVDIACGHTHTAIGLFMSDDA